MLPVKITTVFETGVKFITNKNVYFSILRPTENRKFKVVHQKYSTLPD